VGLGFWLVAQTPNPQSPIPNPHYLPNIIPNYIILINISTD